MSDNVIQTSFSAGELSPNLTARVDFAKFRSGAATMRNFFVDYRSGASTRPGTEFIMPGPGGKVRLVRFQQSVDVTYVLMFSDRRLWFITNGAPVVQPAFGISNITQSGTAVVLATGAQTYAVGDMVYINGVSGMPQINNRFYYINSGDGFGNVGLTDTLSLLGVNSLPYDPYISGGTIQKVHVIASPYYDFQLDMIKFSQNASVMNITHPNHPPYVLTLVDALNWTLVPAVFGSTAPVTTINTIAGTTTGTVSYKYAVTVVDSRGQEGAPSPVSVLNGVDDLRVTPGTNTFNWTSVIPVGGGSYNIYGSSPSYTGLGADIGGLGFMGSTDASVVGFADSNIAPDFSQTPPIPNNPFLGINPAVSSYFQQRLVFANGGGDLVDAFWASKTGAYYNFDFSNPTLADDSIEGQLVSLEVNEIKSLIPMPTGLVALTTKGAWIINGGAGGVATQGGPITPVTATATPQAYIGANDVPPIVINYDIIFVQQKGAIVRDMTFNIYANIYTGNDISILSSHLFYGHQILEWAYAEEPFKIIWCVRDDGVLLSLTLNKEQDMYGWARHDTLGNFKSVCTVTEGHADATYVAVARPNIGGGGGNPTYIERMAEREFTFGPEDAFCVDAGLRTVPIYPNSTVIFIGQPFFANRVQIATDLPSFAYFMVDWVIRVNGGIFRIDEFINSTNVYAQMLRPAAELPNDPQHRIDPALPGTWTLDYPFTHIYGLDHLEGQKVSVLADGGVYNDLVVQNATVILPVPATRAVVGYGFQAQLQTMYLDLGSETNTIQGKRKKVGALTVRVKDTRGIKAGMTFDTVTPIKELNRSNPLGLPTELITADERIVMDPLWDVPGQICIQIDDPLPATVLGVIPEVVLGDGGK